MNSHKNARTTFEGRKLLVERIAVMGLVPAASAAGISVRTARKWLGRFRQSGPGGLLDRSSRPLKTRCTVDAALLQRIEQLRRTRMPMRNIAAIVGRSMATVSRVLARLELSSLKALEPASPVLRYEREAPGELLHMDTKKLGKIVRPSHRVTGNRRDSVEGAGWEFAHVAIDDHSRAGFVQMYDDERKDSTVAFLQAAVAHYAALGVKIKRLLTDNGPAYRSRLFARTCLALGIRHTFTRPYRPQTNGKAERFIQTCLREWAYGRTWRNSTERTAWLPKFLALRLLQRAAAALGTRLQTSSFSPRREQPIATQQLGFFAIGHQGSINRLCTGMREIPGDSDDLVHLFGSHQVIQKIPALQHVVRVVGEMPGGGVLQEKSPAQAV